MIASFTLSDEFLKSRSELLSLVKSILEEIFVSFLGLS